MQRGLVVVDDSSAHGTLLREAAEWARANGGELVLLSYLTPEEVEENLDAVESIERMEGEKYSQPSALDAARKFGRDFVAETGGEGAVEYEISAAVIEEDELGETILETASETDCDHVFIVGRKRSPTGKALFGDVTQRVILNFDGLVTTLME
ncbi:universal stress protein [Halopelagius fulvigenes]|uniref:Universal stress protein n=1 Tax=Halopelagius fulvigenes TaxID=1198324 RepID=A0ABD5U2B2_9EURY